VLRSGVFLENIPNVGLNENTLAKNIKLFPNPVTEKLFIEGISEGNVKVINLVGEMIIEKNNTNSIDVSSLNSGIYFLQITSGNVQSVIKFIKN
jgi:Secretion system C-terminal sorting domain